MRKRQLPNPFPHRATCLPPDVSAKVRAALDANRDKPGALLPVLHAVQDASATCRTTPCR